MISPVFNSKDFPRPILISCIVFSCEFFLWVFAFLTICCLFKGLLLPTSVLLSLPPPNSLPYTLLSSPLADPSTVPLMSLDYRSSQSPSHLKVRVSQHPPCFLLSLPASGRNAYQILWASCHPLAIFQHPSATHGDRGNPGTWFATFRSTLSCHHPG